MKKTTSPNFSFKFIIVFATLLGILYVSALAKGECISSNCKDGKGVLSFSTLPFQLLESEESNEMYQYGIESTDEGFRILENGLQMKMLVDKKGPKADSGFISKVHIVVRVNDSVVFDSKTMNNNQPVMQPINPGRNIADLMLGFMQMSQGDKAIFRVISDSIFQDPQKRPPFIKVGDMMTWEVEMVELKSPKEIEKARKQLAKEENIVLNKYIKDNNISAKKTASGMYIAVIQKGSGELVGTGRLARVNYTGRLLDGTVFDSNVDPKFEHTEPFEFLVGKGDVILGWDEGVATLEVGTKAKLIIPSGMAYGDLARPPNDVNPKGIPANSPLVFDVQVLGVSKNFPMAVQALMVRERNEIDSLIEVNLKNTTKSNGTSKEIPSGLKLPFIGKKYFETRKGINGTGTPQYFIEINDKGDVYFDFFQINQADGERTEGKYYAGKFKPLLKCELWDEIRYFKVFPSKIIEVDKEGNKLSSDLCCEFEDSICPCEDNFIN